MRCNGACSIRGQSHWTIAFKGYSIMHGKREYGDYQTPIDFAEKVCRYLRDCCRIKPSAVVEPTCGIGGFLKSSLLFEANEYYGIEINAEYCRICRNFISEEKVKIIHSDFFSFSPTNSTLSRSSLISHNISLILLLPFS